jgi:hypothetical protein
VNFGPRFRRRCHHAPVFRSAQARVAAGVDLNPKKALRSTVCCGHLLPMVLNILQTCSPHDTGGPRWSVGAGLWQSERQRWSRAQALGEMPEYFKSGGRAAGCGITSPRYRKTTGLPLPPARGRPGSGSARHPTGIVLRSACTDSDKDRTRGKSYEQ